MAEDHQQQFRNAQELYKQRKYAEALSLLDGLLARFPQTKELLLPRAQCLHHLARLQEALAVCDSVIEKWNDTNARNLRARIQLKLSGGGAGDEIPLAPRVGAPGPSNSIPPIPPIPPIPSMGAAPGAPAAGAPYGSPASAGAFCSNHPTAPAHARCSGCSEPFCINCLVDIHGRMYCGSCKVLALQGMAGAPLVTTRRPTAFQVDNTSLENLKIDLDGPIFGGVPVGRCDDIASGGGGGRSSGTAKEAKEALAYAILSWFCCGLIFGIVALKKAGEAKSEIARHPGMSGGGIATAAQIIAILGIVFWALGLFLRLAGN